MKKSEIEGRKRAMTAITIYLTARPCIPVCAVRDAQGAICVGAAGGWEFSRPLMAQEIASIEEPKAAIAA